MSSENPFSFLYPSSLLSFFILSVEKLALLPITFGQKYYFMHHTFEIFIWICDLHLQERVNTGTLIYSFKPKLELGYSFVENVFLAQLWCLYELKSRHILQFPFLFITYYLFSKVLDYIVLKVTTVGWICIYIFIINCHLNYEITLCLGHIVLKRAVNAGLLARWSFRLTSALV